MVGGLNINLFDFQEKAVIKLADLVGAEDSKQTIVMKAPTAQAKLLYLLILYRNT